MPANANENDPVEPDVMADLVEEIGLSVIDWVELPARRARCAPVPLGLALPVRNELQRVYANGLYSHQAAGIEAALERV